MPLLPNSPCHERWSTLTPNGDGRYCQRCDKTVVDLTQLTRRQAEKRVLAAGGAMCGRLRVDPSGAPVFRPEPARAPSLVGVATASLLAACGSTTESESASTPSTLASVEEHAPEVTTGGDHLLGADSPTGSLAAPMMPLADDRDLEATAAATEAPVAAAIVVAAVVEEDGVAVPTADQLTLTEAKEEERRPARRRRRSATVSTAADPAAPPSTGGRRNNGAHGSVVSAPITAPGPAINSPPPTVYMGGISYIP